MRHYLLYLTVAFLAFGLTLSSYGQSVGQRTLFIESQPDSPLLIRDLTATILPVNKYRTSPELEVTFYMQNISKKKIKAYQYQNPAENDSNFEDDKVSGFGLSGDLLPGESYQQKLTMSVEGESLVYRIRDVEFKDGTKWKAKPFNAAKAKKSARITATVQKTERNTKPEKVLTREWGDPVFNDNVLKVINGKPQTIEGVRVQTKRHELKSERIDDVEYCPASTEEIEKFISETPPDIINNEQYYTIIKFTTYEINGRIFAYVVPYEAVDAETHREIGVGFQSVYVDEDGSGFFRMRCNKSELESLPEWVKLQASK